MKARKYIVALFISVFCILLTGCTRFGSLADDETVLSKVEKEVTDEEYSYVSQKSKFGIPRKVEYTFKSEERELEFIAVSTLAKKYSNSVPITTYGHSIKVLYSDAVHDLYLDRINEVLEKTKCYSYSKKEPKLVFTDEDQFDEVAELLAKANEIYHEETDYNEEYWLCDNPVLTIYVYTKIDQKEVNGGKIEINGSSDKADNLMQLNNCFYKSISNHAKEEAENKIEDVLAKSKCYDRETNIFTFKNENHLDEAAELLEQANSIVNEDPACTGIDVYFYMVVKGEAMEYSRPTKVDGIKSKEEYRQEIDDACEHCKKTKADYDNSREKF